MTFSVLPLTVSGADFGWILLGLLVMFTALSVVVLSLVWLERKALGRLQRRLGPTRTGPMGLLQPVADAVKLVLKEDIIPASSERAIFWAAPLIVIVSAFMIWVTIPGTQAAVLRNLDLGLFYIIAFAVIGILGLVLAGWGSANKYGTLGGLRAAAQLISYEIPIIMVVIAMAMLAESLDVQDLVNGQSDYPYLAIQPLGLVIFFIAGLAEVGRTPFDIYFAESEIVGGPFVEYSGAHWSVFFLAEYINTFAVAALVTLLFLGGWSGPWLSGNWGIVWFLIKAYGVVMAIFWVRGHLSQAAHRPVDGLRLEGDGAAVVLHRPHHRRLQVLRFAGLVPDPDVAAGAGGDILRGLPSPGGPRPPGGRGLEPAAEPARPPSRGFSGSRNGGRSPHLRGGQCLIA